MVHIFYRKNKHSISKFLSYFTNDLLDQLVKSSLELSVDIEEISQDILDEIDSLINSDSNNLNYKFYLSNKRKIKKEKLLTNIIDDHLGDKFKKYNELIILRDKIEERIKTELESNFENHKQALRNFFTEEDLLLFRNNFLKKKLQNPDNNLKKKDRLSLYKYASQLCLKTGGVGTVSSVGAMKLQDGEAKHLQPKQSYVISPHSYIQNRMVMSLILLNIESYQDLYYVNTNYVRESDYIIFKTLIDDPNSNIFSGQEREIRLKLATNIEWLINQKSVTYKDMLEYFSISEIKQLLRFGVLLVEQSKPGDIFSWKDRFIDLQPDITDELNSIYKDLNLINQNFTSELFDSLTVKIQEFCTRLQVNTLDFPVLTIDTYCQDSTFSNSEIRLLERFSSVRNELSQFYSIFDASKKVEELAYMFVKQNYATSVTFDNFVDLDNFFRDMSEFIFSQINLGALRSGFFEGEDFPIIQSIIDYISKENTQTVILKDSNLRRIFNIAEKYKYNLQHSYAFFLQAGKSRLYLNHVYKGYGIFNNRYRDSFKEDDFETQYGFENVFDIPYYFGFNANKRPEKPSFDVLGLSSYGSDANITYKDISIVADDSHRNLRFLDKNNKTFHFSFLGSMTPMVLPKTIAMFNSISLTGGMYFDIADLVLRSKVRASDNLSRYEAPEVCFKDSQLVISRKKILFKTSYLKALLKDKSKYEKNVLLLNKLFGHAQIYIREFSVDSNFKNKFLKPIFINLNSILGLENFIAYIDDIEWVTIEEAQPELSGGNLIEYIVESENTVNDKLSTVLDKNSYCVAV